MVSGNTVWLFQGNKVSQPSAAFSKLGRAVHWIGHNSLSGMLTAYPLNEGVYDWAVRRGFYRPKSNPDPTFIGKFSSASQQHYHFEGGDSPELSPLNESESSDVTINHGASSPSTFSHGATLWVFLGEQARHAAATFDDELLGHQWCAKHRLTGLLKPMPLDVPIYDWVRTYGAADPQLRGPEVIANFWVETDRDVSFLNGYPRPAKPANLQVS